MSLHIVENMHYIFKKAHYITSLNKGTEPLHHGTVKIQIQVILNQEPYKNAEILSAGSVVISAWHGITDVFVTGPILHKIMLTDSSKFSPLIL